MKIQIALVLMVSLLPACGAQVNGAIQAAQEAGLSSEDAAAIQLYLDDMTDSAAEEESSTEVKTETSTEVESQTKDDIKEGRLNPMVEKLFSELDVNADGSLTIDEFLAGPAKRTDDKGLSDEIKAKIEAKLTADFEAAAGEDGLLSQDEAKILMKACAPRVGQHRMKQPKGKQEERQKETAEGVIAKFDTNADGQLSKEETQAMIDAHKAELEKFKEEVGFGRPDAEGRMPGDSRGPGKGAVEGEVKGKGEIQVGPGAASAGVGVGIGGGFFPSGSRDGRPRG